MAGKPTLIPLSIAKSLLNYLSFQSQITDEHARFQQSESISVTQRTAKGIRLSISLQTIIFLFHEAVLRMRGGGTIILLNVCSFFLNRALHAFKLYLIWLHLDYSYITSVIFSANWDTIFLSS